MSWVDVGKKIIEYGAPVLGFTIGGPAGAAFGAGVAKIFGADPVDPADVVAKIQADPDAATKLKQFELQNKVDMENLHIKSIEDQLNSNVSLANADLNDVQEAREMEIAKDSWVPEFLTVSIFIAISLSLVLLFFFKVPDENKTLIIGIVLLLGWLFMVCCRFWLGGNIPTLQDIEKLRGK